MRGEDENPSLGESNRVSLGRNGDGLGWSLEESGLEKISLSIATTISFLSSSSVLEVRDLESEEEEEDGRGWVAVDIVLLLPFSLSHVRIF